MLTGSTEQGAPLITLMTTSEYTIDITNVEKSFGSKKVLHGLSLTVSPGCVYGLVGLNGAGKTTLLRIILGLLHVQQGTIKVLGYSPQDHATALYQQTGVVLEHNGFSGDQTFMENMHFFGAAKHLTMTQVSEYIDMFWTELRKKAYRTKVKHLSRGQKMECALCRAFLGWPRLCVLDEPTTALDVDAYDRFCTLVGIARKKGCTVIISSHQLDTIEQLCDNIGILKKGVLHELSDQSHKDIKATWLFQTADTQENRDLLEEIAQSRPVYVHGYWQVPISEPSIQVPLIVKKLVEKGAAVMEVRPLQSTIKSILQNTREKDHTS